MKRVFVLPTITKVDFCLADSHLCSINVTSGVTTDYGIITDMTIAQLGSQTE